MPPKGRFVVKKFRRASVRGPGFNKTGKRKFCGREMLNTMSQMAKRIKRIDRTIETKSGVLQISDGTEYGHNALNIVNNIFLGTLNGTLDNDNSRGQRIGDQIQLIGVSFSLMLELNERYSDVTFRMMVIRGAKGDAVTTSTLWQGASVNKMLDNINRERFTVLHTKYVKIKAPNMAIIGNAGQVPGSGFTQGGATTQQSRATRIFKFFVPGKKFTRSGILQYENNSQQPKFFDYSFVIYAYSNYSTSEALGFFVGRLNDCFIKIHYKDA